MKQFNEYSPEELREISRRGGIASGASRRRKKRIKEFYKILFKEAMNNAKKNDTSCTLNQIKKEFAKIGIKPDRTGNQFTAGGADRNKNRFI